MTVVPVLCRCLGAADLASPLILPFTVRTTLRRPIRDECDVHDMMFIQHHTPAWDGVSSSRTCYTFLFLCFHLFLHLLYSCRLFISERLYFFDFLLHTAAGPGLVFFMGTASLGGMHVGHFMKTGYQPHGYGVGHTRLVICLMSYLNGMGL